MRISSVHLKNFRRFTDLEIREVPASAKLVLLIGSNGSGKSSVFDAFEHLNQVSRNAMNDQIYYRKDKEKEFEAYALINDGTKLGLKYAGSPWNMFRFYGRTSFRQVPSLTLRTLGQGQMDVKSDNDRPTQFILRDNRFEHDIEAIVGYILSDVFTSGNTTERIKALYVDPINSAFQNIFGDGNGTRLELIKILPPLEGKTAQIMFRKGTSEIHYDSLSAGEKEVVNILFNLLARKQYYQDTVYFFDEIDLHLNTRLQFNLLKELTENWIPENCQFWTASHSLGFIDYANQADHACIIDFDDLDFDHPQVLQPEAKSTEVYNVALPKEFVADYVKKGRFVFCENQDEDLYTGLALPNTVFAGVVDKHAVFHRSSSLGIGLVDRDYLSDQEVNDVKSTYPNLKVLPYYSIENLLFHPDNIEEQQNSAGKAFDKAAYTKGLIVLKNERKDYLIAGIAKARDGYPYFKENAHHQRRKVFAGAEAINAVIDLLRSDKIEDFFKVFPAKDIGSNLPERQNLNKSHLVQTNWFKAVVEAALI